MGPGEAMRASARTGSWAALVCALLVQPLPGQEIVGLVLYNHTDTPVSYATVSLLNGAGEVLASVTSGPDGRFALKTPGEGAYSIHVEHLSAFAMVDGPFEVAEDRSAVVTFHIVPQPIALEEIAVSVEGRSMSLSMAGFYERSRAGFGHFLNLQDIKARNPIRLADLVRTVPGVQYFEGSNAGFGGYPIMSYALRSDLWSEDDLGASIPCLPRVYVDGVMVEPGGKSRMPSQGFDQIVGVTDVAAMEVYRSPAEVPVRFGGMTACGVILIWTLTGLGGP